MRPHISPVGQQLELVKHARILTAWVHSRDVVAGRCKPYNILLEKGLNFAKYCSCQLNLLTRLTIAFLELVGQVRAATKRKPHHMPDWNDEKLVQVTAIDKKKKNKARMSLILANEIQKIKIKTQLSRVFVIALECHHHGLATQPIRLAFVNPRENHIFSFYTHILHCTTCFESHVWWGPTNSCHVVSQPFRFGWGYSRS